MEYTKEEYTKHYIVQALFKLMNENEYDKISVIDIVNKAGVGRATFYRHFKKKEDIIIYFFEHNRKDFIANQHYYPRCKEDYIAIVKDSLYKFKEKKEVFKLLRKAHLESLYLDYLNQNYLALFSKDYPNKHPFEPLIYSGMLFNISIAWLDHDCQEDINELAFLIVDKIYKNDKNTL